MALKHDVLNALAQHRGAAKGIRARDLATQLRITPRRLRRVITELRSRDGHAICGRPSTGYFVATNAQELDSTLAFLRHRIETTVRTMTRLTGQTRAALLGQMNLVEIEAKE